MHEESRGECRGGEWRGGAGQRRGEQKGEDGEKCEGERRRRRMSEDEKEEKRGKEQQDGRREEVM